LEGRETNTLKSAIVTLTLLASGHWVQILVDNFVKKENGKKQSLNQSCQAQPTEQPQKHAMTTQCKFQIHCIALPPTKVSSQ